MILTEDGKTLTGILGIRNGYIETATGLIVGSALTSVVLYASGVTLTKHIFIEKDDIWYTPR